MFSLIKQAFCLKKKKKDLDSFFGNLSGRQAKSKVRSLHDQVTKDIAISSKIISFVPNSKQNRFSIWKDDFLKCFVIIIFYKFLHLRREN